MQFNDITWRTDLLGEFAYLLTAPRDIPIKKIHESTYIIKQILADDLKDIVPSYHSIAIFVKQSLEDVVTKLSGSDIIFVELTTQKEIIKLPICYDLGLDLKDISAYSGLTIEKVIELHLSGTYTSQFIGFTPGFVYADGLDPQLACPRKQNPRKQIEAGSIGIGGSQTGIYSLASPGGWNILGRTPIQLFDVKRVNPMLIEVGTSFKFYKITKEEFDAWEN